MYDLNNDKGSRVCSKRTICEVHRQIYDLLVIKGIDDKEIIALLNEAYCMGIHIVDKLVKRKLTSFSWEKNENREEIRRLRELRVTLLKKRKEKNGKIFD